MKVFDMLLLVAWTRGNEGADSSANGGEVLTIVGLNLLLG